MSNPRTSIEDLQLQASPNLLRAKKRDADAAALSLTPEARNEIAQLDELIARAMSACRRGHTFRGRANPAYQHLHVLVRTRDMLLKGRKPAAKSAADVLAAANKLLGAN